MSAAGPVQVRGLGQQYDRGHWALRDVRLDLGAGVTALVGVNGAGKSTLLSALSGALRPTAGTVLVDGVDLYSRRRKRALCRVALMPQHLSAPGTLTALEVVSLLGWMRGLRGKEVRTKAEQALAAVGLQDRGSSKVRELSGGMKRRVALAQALVTEPDVLLLDEPSTGLDPQQRRRMVEIINTLPGTVLFSSHVMEDVVETADRVVVLHEGRVLFDDTPTQLDGLAPAGASPSRRAEEAFLHLLSTHERLS